MKPGRSIPTGEVKRRIGWEATMFYDARIRILREGMSAENVAKLNAMSYPKQCAIVARMIEKGLMI